MKILNIRRLVLVWVALAAPHWVAAQELEEIIVTAERREASELQTPISLEVFTADDLAIDRIQTVSDLQNATPNLTVSYSGFTVQSVNIRGIGNSIVNPNIQPGVAVFQDGLLMAETVVLQQGFLDVETLEVLRGPQGTFVGQSSTGGALRINSVRPDLDGISGFIDVLGGTQRNVKLSGAINLPLSDTVATRFAFNQERRDSYFQNNGILGTGGIAPFTVGPRPGKVDDSNFRATILWQPSEALSILARAELNTSDTDGTAPYSPNLATFVNPNDPTGFGTSQFASFAEPGNDPHVLGYNLLDSTNHNTSDRYSLDVSYAFDSGMEFRSLTGFQHNNLRVVEDQDGTRANGISSRNNVGPDNDYYSQEFNLLSPEGGRFSWIVGASFFHRTTPVHFRTDTSSAPACGYNPANGVIVPCPAAGALPAQATIITVETLQRHNGLFGQLTWDISDSLELELGARSSQDDNLDTTTVDIGVLGPPPADCPNPAATAALPAQGTYFCFNAVNVRVPFEDTTPTYKVGLNWTPGDNHFIYAFYARGYKSGGVNGGLAFEPELVDDIEIGWKTELLDGRMQLQLGAFHMDYKQMQQSAFLIRPSTGNLNSSAAAIQNLGDSTIQGVEASINALFGNLGLNFSAGYTESDLGGITTVDARFLPPSTSLGGANYVKGCIPGETPVPGPAGCFDYVNSGAFRSLSGAENLYSPKLSYSFSLNYGIQLSSGATVRPRVAFSHQDSSFGSIFQLDDYFLIDERDLVNVSVTYEKEDWELQVYCINCSDEVFVASNTGPRIVYSDPQSAGVRFRKRF